MHTINVYVYLPSTSEQKAVNEYQQTSDKKKVVSYTQKHMPRHMRKATHAGFVSYIIHSAATYLPKETTIDSLKRTHIPRAASFAGGLAVIALIDAHADALRVYVYETRKSVLYVCMRIVWTCSDKVNINIVCPFGPAVMTCVFPLAHTVGYENITLWKYGSISDAIDGIETNAETWDFNRFGCFGLVESGRWRKKNEFRR